MTNIAVPEAIDELETRLAAATAEKKAAAQRHDFAEASRLRDEADRLAAELEKARKEWERKSWGQPRGRRRRQGCRSGGHDDRRARAAHSAGRRHQTARNGTALRNAVIGQDAAIEKIVKAIQRNRLGLKDPGKPIGTFMFLGPTGVGQDTSRQEALRSTSSTASDALIRIDMSEVHGEVHRIAPHQERLPGYVGYEEGGQLTERVRRHPTR